MREKAYETKIRKFLELNGAYVIKHFGCAYSKAGVADLLCCINGKFVAIEVKSDTGKPSPLQCHHQKLVKEAGGISLILYPKDGLEPLKNILMQSNLHE